MKISQIIEFNPRTRIPKGQELPFIEMAALPIHERDIPSYQYRVASGSGSKFRNGDTLLARITPCLENGKGGMVRGIPGDGIAHGSTEFIVMRARHETDVEFVYYVSRLPEFRRFAIQQMSGTSGRQRVNWQSLTEFELADISEVDRRHIGLILSALDDKIELNRRMNETLEAMARAIFKDWFIDFGPTRDKAECREPYLSSELWELFPDALDDEDKPVGWSTSEIGKEVQAAGGATPSTKEPAYWDGGEYHWATPKDLSKLSAPVLLGADRKITDAGVHKISSGLLPIGTVLLSSRAPIGYLAIAEVPTAVNQGFIAMVCNNRVSNVFVLFWCYENLDYIKGISGGSTFAEISKRAFRPIPITVPSAEVLEAFDSIVQPLYRQIVANTKESSMLAETRDLLLPKLMSGEIRLRDAEKAVEAVA